MLRLLAAASAAFAALAPSAFAQGSASFAQLEGKQGCVVQAGGDAPEDGGDCARARAVSGPTSVAVSPDQRHVYVTTGFGGSNAVTTFARDQQTGALEFRSCISDSGGDGRVGTDGFCSDGDALLGASDIEFSPDGRFAYVTSSASNGLAWFERDADTGALTQRGCLKAFPRRDRCQEALALEGADGVAVSADGKSVYVTAGASGAVTAFSRDAQTGAPSELMCVSDSGSDGRCVNGTGLEGASSVVAAVDGKHVYVTAATVGAVTAYSRDAATGRLTQTGCLLDQAPQGGPCASAPALAGAAEATLTPDGRQLIVASELDSALAVFRRDPDSGALEPQTCFRHEGPQGDDELDADQDGEPDADFDADEADAEGCRTAKALGNVAHVVVSPDGRGIFSANAGDYLAAFRRDPGSGGIEQFGCAEEERTYRSCAQSRHLFTMQALAVSADARNLYVASSAGVSVFGASVAIASSSATMNPAGVVRVALACPAARRNGCAGRLRGPRAHSARRYRIARGRTAWVRLQMPATVRRAARRRGSAHVTLVARDARRLTGPSVRRIRVRRYERPQSDASAVARPAADLTFRTIERSAGAGSRITTQRTFAVRTLRKWKQIWRQLHRPAKKLPAINFAKRTIIVVTQGEQPNTGYRIRIERVVLDGGEVTLHVVDTEPDPASGCVYGQVITHPYHIVSVRRTGRPLAPVERRIEPATC